MSILNLIRHRAFDLLPKKIRVIAFILVTSFFSIYAASFCSNDEMLIFRISKIIGPSTASENDVIYFIRLNETINIDSIAIELPQLLKSDGVDSVLRNQKWMLNDCSIHLVKNPIYYLHFSVIHGGIRDNYYSLKFYIDTTNEILGISALKWQKGFIEPVEEGGAFAHKICNLILKLKNKAEYIGKSETNFKIKDCDISSIFPSGPKRFWKWFKKQEDFLFEYDTQKRRVENNIKHKLPLMGPDITFEIGPIENNKRQIKLVADEYLKERIMESIPKLNHWNVTFEVKLYKNP
jgi:hypothetical protein